MALVPPRRLARVLPVLLGISLAVAACGSSSEGSTTSVAPSGEPLTVCSDIPYEPFEFGDPANLTGFDVDLVDGIGARLDRPVTFVATPLDQFAAALAAGTCELIASALPITGTAGLAFSDPYLHVDQSLLVRSPDSATYPTVATLGGHTVGVLADSPSADLAASALPADASVQGFTTFDEAVDALRAGTVDAVLGDAPLTGHAALSDDSLTVTQTLPSETDYGLATAPTDATLLAGVNQALAQMTADGSLDELRTRWFGPAG